MSDDNIEGVRGWAAALDAGRMPHELVAEFWDPRGDYYPWQKFPGSRPCHGPEEIERFLADFEATWDDYEHRVEEVTQVGDDRALIRSKIVGTGSASGLALTGEIFHCCWMRQGKFMRVEEYATERRAREALG